MPSTYTTSLKIQEIANGEQSGIWGTTTNTNWTLVEQAIAGVQSITMTNSDYTLSNLNGILDESRNMVLIASGTNSAVRQIIAPLVEKVYIVKNDTVGGYSITIGGATGSVVTIPNGASLPVFCDGSNFYAAQTGFSGSLSIAGSLTVSGTSNLGAANISGTAAFTGATSFSVSPTAPTQASGTNNTTLATTAFVANATAASIPSGSVVLFYQAAAPTGWTKLTSVNDSALRVVSGSTGGTTGGTTAFSTVFANQTPTINVGGLSVGATTLNTTQIPSHNHTFPIYIFDGTTTANLSVPSGNTGNYLIGNLGTSSVGSGSSHTHSISGSATSSAITLNVQYANIIMCSKD